MAQDGEVRQHPNGGTYQRQGGVWVLQGGDAPVEQATPGPMVVGTPKPSAALDLRSKQIGIQGDIRGLDETELDIQAKQRKPRETQFDQSAKLADDFRQRPSVKMYTTALPLYASALSTPENAEGDLVLINAFAKITDPTSAVLTGEADTVAQSGGYFERTVAKLQKDLALGGGKFSPEQRVRLRKAVATRMQALNQAFISDRKQMMGTAERFGLDPRDVIGEHPGEAFQQIDANFLGRPVRNVDGTLGPPPFGSTPAPPSPPRLGNDEFIAEFNRLIAAGDRAALDEFLASQRATASGAEIDEAMRAGGARANVKEAPGILSQLGDATVNTVAGIGQGLAAIPDAFTSALGATAGVIADSLPGVPEWASDALKNPVTIGNTIERVAPTPEDTAGRVARFSSQIGGGIAGFPAAASNALVNGVVGRLPAAAGAPMNALTPGQQVMQAASELSKNTGTKIQPLAADVAGPTTRRVTSVAAQLPLSAAFIVKGGQRLAGEAQAARDVVARGAGDVVDPELAGEAAIKGAKAFRVRTSGEARRLYGNAEKAADGVTVQPQTLLAKIGEHVREQREILGGSPALAILDDLSKKLGEAGAFSIKGVRGMRTVLRGKFVKEGMTPTDAERIVNDLVTAAGDDIANSLTKAGKPEAARAYKAADKFWAERMATINNAIKPIIGAKSEKSGEQVLRAIQQASRGDTGRISQLMAALPAEDAATVRATLINQLGRQKPGVQNAEGTGFSLNEFLTHWNQMQPRARQLLFGKEAADLTRLAKVAQGSKEASRYANSSNTGGVVGLLATGSTLTTDLLTMGGTALAQVGGGALLSAPGFARLLAGVPKNPGAVKSYAGRFGVIASQNPALAPEIASFQRALLQAANNNLPQAGRLVAESPNRGPNKPD